MRKTVTVGAVLGLAVLSVAQVASAAQILLGEATGGVGVYYNAASAETPANQAYLKAQFSLANDNGAAFSFAPAFAGPAGANDLGQFGFDLVIEAPTSNGSVPTPTLTAYDRNFPNTPVAAGDVDWAINNYGSSAGPGNAANTVVHSQMRGGNGDGSSVTLTPTLIALGGGNFQMDIAGSLESDGFYHWFYGSQTALSLGGVTDTLSFEGTLIYTHDANNNGVDFYQTTAQTGTIKFYMNTLDTNVPDGASAMTLLGGALAGLNGLALLLRRRTIG